MSIIFQKKRKKEVLELVLQSNLLESLENCPIIHTTTYVSLFTWLVLVTQFMASLAFISTTSFYIPSSLGKAKPSLKAYSSPKSLMPYVVRRTIQRMEDRSRRSYEDRTFDNCFSLKEKNQHLLKDWSPFRGWMTKVPRKVKFVARREFY